VNPDSAIAPSGVPSDVRTLVKLGFVTAENPVPEVPDDPLEPEVPDDPLEPEVPDDPLEPEVPDDPLEPEVPDDPLEPEVPDDPEEPLEPEDPLVPAIPTVYIQVRYTDGKSGALTPPVIYVTLTVNLEPSQVGTLSTLYW
jgi:hypothetical protein